MISHEKKFIFVHIPRTGGTHLSPYLEPYCDEESLRFSPFEEEGHLHATLYEYVQYYGPAIKDYTIFTIVRNPWDRILSQAFKHNNGEFEREHFKKLVLAPWDLGLQPHSQFNYFLNEKYRRDKGATEHTCVFIRWAPPRILKYRIEVIDWPFFLEFENYAIEVPQMLNALGVKYDAEKFEKKTNTTKHKHYSHYYEEEERIAIAQTCGFDLQMLSYRYEDRKNK